MEAGLTAYAAQRRRELGDRLEMSAHVRARLQREVERVARLGRATGGVSGWSWRAVFRLPWVWAAMVVVLVGVGSWWWRANPVRFEVAAEPSVATKREAPAAESGILAVASAPAAAGARTAPVELATVPRPAPAAAPLGAPLSLADPAVYAFGVPVPPVQVRFSQRATAPTLPALNSFRFEQAGRELQIVDEDGSVYRAELAVLETTAVAPRPTRVALPVPTSAVPAGESVRATRLRAGGVVEAERGGGVESSVPAVVGVTALGTNRGLQQRVMLTGNLLVTNFVGAPVIAPQTALLTNQAALQFLFSNARFEGQVTVGTTNRFPLLAVPVEP